MKEFTRNPRGDEGDDGDPVRSQNVHQQMTAFAREGWIAGGGFFASIMSGFLIGFALDWWLGTRPLFIICGIVAGAISGFYGMHAWAQEQERRHGRG